MSTRKWREGDEEPLCAYLNEDACYLVADNRGRLWLRRTGKTGGGWDRLSTRFGKVGVADWRYLVATYGPLTEVISSTEEEAPSWSEAKKDAAAIVAGLEDW